MPCIFSHKIPKPTMTKQNTTTFAFTAPLLIFLAVAGSFAKLKCSAFSSTSAPSFTQREQIVRNYFDGVNKKDRAQIRSCFSTEAYIRDVCALNSSEKAVNPEDLADRCMEFLQAHPDCKVDFYYGPKCSHDDNWVVAHWYETVSASCLLTVAFCMFCLYQPLISILTVSKNS